MKANVGSTDKAVRILLAVGLFSLYFLLDGSLRYLSLIGLVPLITAFVSWCPLYTILGLNTCPLDTAKH